MKRLLSEGIMRNGNQALGCHYALFPHLTKCESGVDGPIITIPGLAVRGAPETREPQPVAKRVPKYAFSSPSRNTNILTWRESNRRPPVISVSV